MIPKRWWCGKHPFPWAKNTTEQHHPCQTHLHISAQTAAQRGEGVSWGSLCARRTAVCSVMWLSGAEMEVHAWPSPNSPCARYAAQPDRKCVVFCPRSGEGLPPGLHGWEQPTTHCFYHTLGPIWMGADSLRAVLNSRRVSTQHGRMPSETQGRVLLALPQRQSCAQQHLWGPFTICEPSCANTSSMGSRWHRASAACSKIVWSFSVRLCQKKGYTMDPAELAPVQALKDRIPKTVGDLRKHLGFLSYFRQYIPNFSRIAKPLYSLLVVERAPVGQPKGMCPDSAVAEPKAYNCMRSKGTGYAPYYLLFCRNQVIRVHPTASMPLSGENVWRNPTAWHRRQHKERENGHRSVTTRRPMDQSCIPVAESSYATLLREEAQGCLGPSGRTRSTLWQKGSTTTAQFMRWGQKEAQVGHESESTTALWLPPSWVEPTWSFISDSFFDQSVLLLRHLIFGSKRS